MKSDIKKHKKKLVLEAEKNIPLLLVNFRSSDFETLGKICYYICVFSEYLLTYPESKIAKKVPKMVSFLNDKYKNSIVLILKNGIKYFSYTSSEIIRFLRGESVHGASDIRDEKRQSLHDFSFENDDSIECEFQISWNWICGPNLRSDTGNLDSGGPFVHKINFNGVSNEFTLIESIVLAITYELWQSNTKSIPESSTKVFVKFNPEWYVELWGKELAEKLKNQLKEYYGLEVPLSYE